MVTRESAHRNLTEIARGLRVARRTASLADAFRLACLLHPDLSDLLAVDLNDRAGRALEPDLHASNRRNDDVGVRVRAYTRGDNGKIDPERLRQLAKANRVWADRYAALSMGGQMAAILGRLRPKAVRGAEIAFP